MEQPINFATLARHFSDEGAAWELVERMIWNGTPVCPHCGTEGRAYFIKARSGCRTSRKGTVSYRRLWKCACCRRQFSVLVGTIFEDTKISLSKSLLAISMMCADKNGVAAYELHRTLGVTNKTAWHMLHRIRETMTEPAIQEVFRGTIVADETWIGGKPSNRHRQGRPSRIPEGGRGRAGAASKKTVVLTLINKDTGKARSRVIANIKSGTLAKALAEQIDMAGSVLHTDDGFQFKQVGHEFVRHEFVDHSTYEYVRGDVSTNQCEGFFSQLKRSLEGTHHHISREHLPRYLAEFDYRYGTRRMSDGQRMADLMTRTTGKRLTYAGVKG